jgi:hypothetical protein
MAYLTKYYGQFYDRQNQAWRVEILLDGYGGSEQEITLAKPPVTFQWSGDNFKYEPIITSSIEVKIIQTSNYQFREFLVSDETDYIVRLKRYNGTNWGTSTIWWTGFLLPDVLTEQYTDTPNVLTIRAGDGLTMLKHTYFVSSGNNRRNAFYTGVAPLSDILCKCLAKLRIDLGSSVYTVNTIIDYLNTYENSHTNADSVGRLSPLTQTYVDQEAFIEYVDDDMVAFSCWDVIENICKVFGARIFLSWDNLYDETGVLAWHIKTINDYDGASIARSGHEVFDGTNYFDLLHQETVSLAETISTTTANFASSVIYANRNHEIEVIPAVQEITTRWNPKNQAPSRYNNVVPNGEFEYHVNDNISDWNNSSSLKSWTVSSGTYVREKNGYNSNLEPFYLNYYGVKLNNRDIYLRSAQSTISDGWGGTNVLWVKVRAYYLVDSFAYKSTTTGYLALVQAPRARIHIKVVDGGTTYHLINNPTAATGYSWKSASAPTGAEIIYMWFQGALVDYNGAGSLAVYPDAVREFFVGIALPSLSGGEGELEIDLYQTDSPLNAGFSERTIELIGATTAVENIKVVYEFCRANLSTASGDFGNFRIKYITNNANIRTSAEPIDVETVIGDAVDGEGFNVGALKLSNNAPTDVWEWNSSVGGVDGETIHKVLSRIINKNYSAISIRLRGDFNTARKIMPQMHFQLSDNSVTKDMVLQEMTWDMEQDIANCSFFENRDDSPTITVSEQHTESLPSVGATTGGNSGTYVPVSIDPNFDAG